MAVQENAAESPTSIKIYTKGNTIIIVSRSERLKEVLAALERQTGIKFVTSGEVAGEQLRVLEKNNIPIFLKEEYYGFVIFCSSMLTDELIDTFRETARDLPKDKRRKFEAKITNQYLDGSARKAESYFGWSRVTVELGQKELETGIICLGNYSARGRKKTEERMKELEKDIRELADRESQTDPKFQTEKKFCVISARSVCEMLEEEKKYKEGSVTERTMSNILNRLGYHLKKT